MTDTRSASDTLSLLTMATHRRQVDLPEDPNLRELTSAKPAFINTPKDGNSPRSEPSGRASLTDGGEWPADEEFHVLPFGFEGHSDGSGRYASVPVIAHTYNVHRQGPLSVQDKPSTGVGRLMVRLIPQDPLRPSAATANTQRRVVCRVAPFYAPGPPLPQSPSDSAICSLTPLRGRGNSLDASPLGGRGALVSFAPRVPPPPHAPPPLRRAESLPLTYQGLSPMCRC